MLLISGLPRTGGTFLNQLLDHHPQIWSHPHEVNIGHPDKWNWPELTPGHASETLWERLRQRSTAAFSRQPCYDKGSASQLPMVISEQLQQQLFLNIRAEAADSRPHFGRAVLNDYFSSYFLAYLDYQRRYAPDKRYLVGHASMCGLQPAFVAEFFAAYPDGILIQTLREPLAWYRSIQHYPCPERLSLNRLYFAEEYDRAAPPVAERYWAVYCESLQTIRQSLQLYPDRILVVTLEQLLQDARGSLAWLAERVGLDWHAALLEQTFNGMPILPNSSHARPGSAPTPAAGGTEPALRQALQAYAEAASELCSLPHGHGHLDGL